MGTAEKLWVRKYLTFILHMPNFQAGAEVSCSESPVWRRAKGEFRCLGPAGKQLNPEPGMIVSLEFPKVNECTRYGLVSQRKNERTKHALGVSAAFFPASLGICVGFCLHFATGCHIRSSQHIGPTENSSSMSLAARDGANSQSTPDAQVQLIRQRSKRVSQARKTESGRYGLIDLVNVGDDTLDFTEFIAQQASAAGENDQRCLLVTMLPRCPSCAAFGYALARTSLRHELGKIRIVRLDLDEFEDELRHLHLPIDRVPSFILLGRSGAIIDFLDAGEWNTNDPAEFAPILEEFVGGRFKRRRHHWVPNPESHSIDL